MKLAFQLLVVDDQPDELRSAFSILQEHLDGKGFDLVRSDLPAPSGPDWDAILNQGRSYDLVMVDYNLSKSKMGDVAASEMGDVAASEMGDVAASEMGDVAASEMGDVAASEMGDVAASEMGDVAAKRLRAALPYTDIIFYSAERRTKLLQLLAEQQVEGVFVAHRQELDEPLVGLADAVIGKAVDLNHMRGIAMAEVAEMDILMEELLVSVFQLDHPDIDAIAKKTVKQLKNSMKSESNRICRNLENGNLSTIVSYGRIFSLYHKYIAFQRLARLLPDVHLAPKLKTLKSFMNDIIQNRNNLAHVKEDSDGKGNVVLRSIRSDSDPLIIDDEWMATFRRDLRKHRKALETLCSALRRNFGLAESTDNSEKDQS